MVRDGVQRWVSVLILLAVTGTLAAAATSPAAGQGPAYSARGPYAVGVRDYVIEDGARPLSASVWYPARDAQQTGASITYQVPGLTIAGQARRDAAPDDAHGSYPLVIFSHGAGGFRFQSTYLTEHLASHGFVVIATDHPGSTLLDEIGARFRAAGDDAPATPEPGNTLDELRANLRALSGSSPLLETLADNFAVRPLDVLCVIAFAESLTAEGGDLAGLIDIDRIAVSGHSFGGYTALAAAGARLDFDALDAWCRAPQGLRFNPDGDPAFVPIPVTLRMALVNCLLGTQRHRIADARGLEDVPGGLWPATTDPRIKAVVALAPWNAAIFGPRGLAAVTVPALIMVGTEDQTTPPAIDAYAHYTHIGSDEKSLVVFEDAGHLLFANAGMGVDDPVWDMGAAHTLVNHVTVAFLRAYLYGDADAAAALAPEKIAYKDVLYHRVP